MSGDARRSGRVRVLEDLLRRGPLSRADLSRSSALAASTVTGLVGTLQSEGLVVELPESVASSGPGRPAVLLAIEPGAGLVAGLDFGKTHLTVAIADLAHRVLAERREPLPPGLAAHEQVRRARTLVSRAVDAAGVGERPFIAIAAGMSGPVQHRSGRLGDSTILPAWVALDARRMLSSAFGRSVHVENDANLGALAEWRWGAAQGESHMIYVKASTGIGGGVLIDGTPFAGAGGTAGEIGHLIVRPGGPACRCGRRGCLEAVAGSGVVVDRVSRSHPSVHSVEDVIRLARVGDPAATLALQECGLLLGTGLGMVLNVLNPSLVVLGGDLAKAEDLLLASLHRGLRDAAIDSSLEDARVVLGGLGERAEVMGALVRAFRGATAEDLVDRRV